MSPGHEKTRPFDKAGPLEDVADVDTTLPQTRRRRDASLDLAEYVDHFRSRVLQDALTEGLRSYWLRRADAFSAAMHKPGDFPGLCSVDQIEANNERLAQKAAACRNHASICIFQDHDAICEHLRVAS